MKEIKIIGIGHKYGVGKDSVASLINYAMSEPLCKSPDVYPTLDEFINGCGGFQNKMWETRRFADKLKECASLILNVPRFMFENQEFKKQVINDKYKHYPRYGNLPSTLMTYRNALQEIGDTMRYSIDENVWVDALFNDWNGERIIIPDVRYENEAQAIKDLGGVLIRVDRDVERKVGASHISETELDDFKFDHYIDNNGTVEELYGIIEQLVKEWGA